MQILNVPIEDIIPNRFQPRLNFDESSLQELAASIKEHGIIQPLVLRRLGDKYEIIAGERRYKASKIAGLTSVPAVIQEMDDKKSAEVAIVENVQRKDLSAIEEAKSYKALLDKGYLTQDELAKKMGLSQSAISNKLRLLSLSEKVQNALMEGKISERHARSLLQLSDSEEQDKWLKTIIEERLTVRELDKRLKEVNKSSSEPVNNESFKVEDNTMNNNVNIIDTKEEKMPNKFFNFLEDEKANMSTEEESVEAPASEVKETVSLPEEEIEMLDFTVPTKEQTPEVVEEVVTPVPEPVLEPVQEVVEASPKEEIINEVKELDLSLPYTLVDNLVNELRNKEFNVSLSKEDTNETTKYVITINKES